MRTPTFSLALPEILSKNKKGKNRKGNFMRITTKGQVTIPLLIREKIGLWPHTEVEFSIEGDKVRLQKVKNTSSRGMELISRMRGKATVKMSTDEIMALTRG
jgi:AbrB family looped-hinge helix DNA binding protein